MTMWYRFVWFFLQPLVRLYFRLTVEGKENMPKTGPVLLASNHCSHLDPPLIALSVFRRLTFLAKEELFSVPVLGSLILSFGAHPVARRQGDVKAIRTALRLLKEGDVLLIFPEGTRSEDGHLQIFENGLAWLSLRAGVPVVPMHITGTYEAYPKGARFPRPAKVHVRLGAPIYPETGRNENNSVNSERVRYYTHAIQTVMSALAAPPEKSAL